MRRIIKEEEEEEDGRQKRSKIELMRPTGPEGGGFVLRFCHV